MPTAPQRPSRFAANGAVRVAGSQGFQHFDGVRVARVAAQGGRSMAPDVDAGVGIGAHQDMGH